MIAWEEIIMRKIIAFSSALLLVTASTASCGNNVKPTDDIEVQAEMADTTVGVMEDTSENTAQDGTSAVSETSLDELTEGAETEKVSVTIPDLSELGIDSGTFPTEAEKYTSEFAVGSELAYKGERPLVTRLISQNDDLAFLEFDGEGNLCFYDGPIVSVDDAPEMTLSDEEYKAMGEKYLKAIQPDFNGFELDTAQVDRENRRCTVSMKRSYGSDDISDKIDVMFDGKGMVYQFSIFRTAVKDVETAERLRQKVVEYGKAYCEKHFHNNSAVSDIEGSCIEIDGTVYGEYSFIVNTGTESQPSYGCYSVLVKDE
jgi:hypothetical protein